MSRKRFGEMPCGVAQALEQIGDWWTLLIIRDAFLGVRRFQQFEQNLGISKNILSRRMADLVENGILERTRLAEPGNRYEYTLSRKGRDLWVVLTALRLWSDKWVFGDENVPLVARDRKSGKRVARLMAVDEDGAFVNPREITLEAGPGLLNDTWQEALKKNERDENE